VRVGRTSGSLARAHDDARFRDRAPIVGTTRGRRIRDRIHSLQLTIVVMSTAGHRDLRRLCRVVLLASLYAAITMLGTARADGFDGQRFIPAVGAAGGFVVERPIVPKHLGWGLGAFVSYGHRPVVVRDRVGDQVVATPLKNAFAVDAVGSLGLFDFLELGVHVPIRPIWSGDDIVASGQPLRARGGLGDVRFVPKVGIVDTGSDSFHFSLGAMLPVTFPTGSGQAMRGSEGVGFEPRLLLGIGGTRWDLIFSGGYLARTNGANNLAGKNEVTFGSAFTLGLARGSTPVDLQIEVYGAHLPDTKTQGGKTPVESLAGVIVWPTDELSLYFGGGPGLVSGLGSPDFRLAFGVRYAVNVPGRDRFLERARDRDGDGIDNEHDRCADEAEDKDDFQDADGCPEADNDKDGILDDNDECPEQAEEVGGDGDGCPDKGRIVIEDGKVVVIGKVQFETGSSTIAKKSEPLVDDMAKTLKEHPEMKKVRIEGHTDDTGPAEVNDRLSKQRAESVKQALIKRGIAANRLETEGYGSKKPMSPNTSPVGRARNRRVEFIILD
jgi:OmpA-OmpF porin, OOP family